MGVSVDYTSNTLFFAVSSGQRPDNRKAFFAPGDFVIQTDMGSVYGLEVGGGTGDSSRNDGFFEEGGPGSNYTLKSSGHTQSVVNLDPSIRPVGSLWLTDGSGAPSGSSTTGKDWIMGISQAGSANRLTQLIGGTWVDGNYVADLYYNYASSLDEHAWIEVAVDLSKFDGNVTHVGWAPACANDNLYLDVELPSPPPPIPEPASLLVWGLLGLTAGGCGWWRRRRLKTR